MHQWHTRRGRGRRRAIDRYDPRITNEAVWRANQRLRIVNYVTSAIFERGITVEQAEAIPVVERYALLRDIWPSSAGGLFYDAELWRLLCNALAVYWRPDDSDPFDGP
jgi:hypothetical protein